MTDPDNYREQNPAYEAVGIYFLVLGSEFWVLGSEFRVQSSGFWVQGSGFRVLGLIKVKFISLQRSNYF